MRFTAYALLSVIVLAAVALLVELALQTIFARSLYREVQKYPPHPFLQATPAQAADHVNAQGFRGDAIEIARRPNTFRIFTLGGSTTLGVTNSYEDSYPFLLQTLLRERHPGVDIEVQNAGCPWYTSAHALVAYQISVRQYEPDLIIFFEAINDIVRSFSPPWLANGEFRPDYSHYLGPYARLRGPEAMSWNGSRSQLWNLIRRHVFRDPDPFNIRDPDNVAKIAAQLEAVDRPSFRSLESFRRYYEGLIHAVQADGREMLTVSQPSLLREGLNDAERRALWFGPLLCADRGTCPSVLGLTRGMDMYNGAGREISGRRGVTFVDAAAAVPKTLEHFVDDVHMKRAGNAILARAVADAIDAAELVQRAMARGQNPKLIPK